MTNLIKVVFIAILSCHLTSKIDIFLVFYSTILLKASFCYLRAVLVLLSRNRLLGSYFQIIVELHSLNRLEKHTSHFFNGDTSSNLHPVSFEILLMFMMLIRNNLISNF